MKRERCLAIICDQKVNRALKICLARSSQDFALVEGGASYGGHDFQHELGITLLRDSEVAVRYEGLAILMQVAKSGEAPAALSLGHELERSRLLYENELNPLSWFILAAAPVPRLRT